MVLHLDEEEEDDEDAEETWEEEGCGDDEKQFAPAAADDDRGEARNRESVAIDVEGRVGRFRLRSGFLVSIVSRVVRQVRRPVVPEACDVITEDCRKCFVASPSGSPRVPSRGARWRSWLVRCSNSTSRV